MTSPMMTEATAKLTVINAPKSNSSPQPDAPIESLLSDSMKEAGAFAPALD